MNLLSKVKCSKQMPSSTSHRSFSLSLSLISPSPEPEQVASLADIYGTTQQIEGKELKSHTAALLQSLASLYITFKVYSDNKFAYKSRKLISCY